MANRRNFSVTLKGSTTAPVDGVNHTRQVTSRTASFGASDYSRKKPRGTYIPPTSYSSQSLSDVEASGIISRTYLPTNQQQLVRSGVVSTNVGNNASAYLTLKSKGILSLGEDDVPPNMVDAAVGKAFSALKNQRTNFGQAYAERRQTADLVIDSIDRVCRDLIGVRRHLGPKKLARLGNAIVKDLPDYFLEVVFGWKPLLSDVHGAIAELDSRDSSDWKVTAKGKVGLHEVVTFNYTKASDAAGACNITADVFHGAYTRIDAVPKNEALVKAKSLGLTNPLSLAWELMPWSFAIDWFYPIGPYFDRLDSALGLDIIGMSTSTIVKAQLVRTGLNLTTPPYRYDSSWFGSRRYVKMSRGAGIQGPSEVFPQFKDPFSSAQRVGTQLALLSQIRKSILRPR